MSLVLFLSWSATIATVGFFLSGLLTCQKMIQSGSAENVPLLPFVTTFLNFKTPLHHNLPLKTMKCPRVDHNVTVPERLCSFAISCMVWASYGVFKGDDALVPVNVIGMITQVLFTLCFFLYCKERGKEIKTVVYAAVVAFSLYVYIDHFLSNDQTRVRHLGLICIVLTITMQASPLATVAKVVQTRSTESMPFIFSFMMVLVSFLWLSYGTVVEDVNIQVPNATGVFLGLLQLSLFCIYPSKPSVNTKL